MPTDVCLGPLCVTPLLDDASLFSFGEYLDALALMVVVWTIADFRYRFRIATAPIELHRPSFVIVAVVGLLILLTDLWRAQNWWVVRGPLISPAAWQALLAAVLLATFLTWAWFAVVRRPSFGRPNAQRYAARLYHALLKASDRELPVIADELQPAMSDIIAVALLPGPLADPRGRPVNRTRLAAWHILELIAHPAFCRHLVREAPGTAIEVFRGLSESQLLRLNIDMFARNLTTAAIAYEESFVYQESEGHRIGLMGSMRPILTAVYGNTAVINSVGSLLDVPYDARRSWTPRQVAAFCNLLLSATSAYLANRRGLTPRSIERGLDCLESCLGNTYLLDDGAREWWLSPPYDVLSRIMGFVTRVLEVMDQHQTETPTDHRTSKDPFDLPNLVGKLIFSAINHAAGVQVAADVRWAVQMNAVWGQLAHAGGRAGLLHSRTLRAVRRLIVAELKQLQDWPNFRGARLLAFMLNITRLRWPTPNDAGGDSHLRRYALTWIKKNYAQLVRKNASIASHCLVDGFTYEAETHMLIWQGGPVLGLVPPPRRFTVDPDPLELPAQAVARTTSGKSTSRVRKRTKRKKYPR